MTAQFTISDIDNIIEYANGNGVDLSKDVMEKLYSELLSEMPYGIAKAREGDPEEWIAEWVIQKYGLGPVLGTMSYDELRDLVLENRRRNKLIRENPTIRQQWDKFKVIEALCGAV